MEVNPQEDKGLKIEIEHLWDQNVFTNFIETLFLTVCNTSVCVCAQICEWKPKIHGARRARRPHAPRTTSPTGLRLRTADPYRAPQRHPGQRWLCHDGLRPR